MFGIVHRYKWEIHKIWEDVLCFQKYSNSRFMWTIRRLGISYQQIGPEMFYASLMCAHGIKYSPPSSVFFYVLSKQILRPIKSQLTCKSSFRILNSPHQATPTHERDGSLYFFSKTLYWPNSLLSWISPVVILTRSYWRRRWIRNLNVCCHISRESQAKSVVMKT